MVDSARLEREREFHNRTFTDEDVRWTTVSKFYSVTDRILPDFIDRIVGACPPNGRLLEYGCGPGDHSNSVGKRRRDVSIVGIDISDAAVEMARTQADHDGLSASFFRMDAENLDFPEATFDVVFGSAILHHLDTNKAISEIRRVLKPTGCAIFHEPLGYNPVFNRFRARTPGCRTVDEHPLVAKDMDRIRQDFSLSMTHYYLMTLAAIPFRNTSLFRPVKNGLEFADKVILKLPLIRNWSWMVIMEMTPK